MKTYSNITDWLDVSDVRKLFADFQSYLRANRLFIRPELAKKLDALAEMMWKEWVTIYMYKQKPEFGIEASAKYEKASTPLIAEVEALVHARLYPTHADDLQA